MLIDTHCHLDFPDFENDRDSVIEHARKNGISRIINIGSSIKGSRRSVELAQRHDLIYASVGMHPHEADSFNTDAGEEIRKLAGSAKVVAIGEIGLDYFKNYSGPENQKAMFSFFSRMAKDMGLAMIIHCRQAQADVLEILKPLLPHKIVLHCFSGDEDFLKTCLDLGFYLSFTLNITYKKAQDLRKLAALTPLERLFLETDAPFLPPENLRGKRNEPAYVKQLAEEIARIKGLSFEEIASITTRNAIEFFGLD